MQQLPGTAKWAEEKVSILYEANEVCNLHQPLHGLLGIHVSILYEANEVCNGRPRRGEARPLPVSILYEANEVCNVMLG